VCVILDKAQHCATNSTTGFKHKDRNLTACALMTAHSCRLLYIRIDENDLMTSCADYEME